MTDKAPVLADRYRLDHLIASGGTGEVWRAHDEFTDSPVAVKVPHLDRAGDQDVARQLALEAQAGSLVDHPAVTAVYDYGQVDLGADEPPLTYMVMELVDGHSLSELLRQSGRLSVEDTLALLSRTAEGLQAAHDCGVVHRDVKPANLLLTSEGEVKLTDFGLAQSPAGTPIDLEDGGGVVFGTVRYMAPEVVAGGRPTAASDLYSLGVVAYRCLAGRSPFAGVDTRTIAAAHLHQPVPPLPADVPAGVRQLVDELLAKDPGDRPPSAAAVARRARDLLAEQDGGDAAPHPASAPAVPPARPATRRRSRAQRLRATLLMLALVLTVVVLAAVFWPSGPAPVPSVTGRSLTRATAALRAQHLKVATAPVNRPRVRPGLVLGQSPAPSAAAPADGVVRLQVATGDVLVPPGLFVGTAWEEAGTELTQLGLRPVQVDVPSGSATPGTIVALSPVGRVPAGTRIRVQVAVAPTDGSN
jgi:serine/threonine-protein kinase